MKHCLRLAVAGLLLGLLVGCTNTPDNIPTQPPARPTSALGQALPSEPAYWPTAGWRSSTPEEQGMDSARLAAALDFLLNQADFDIHSLLVIRHGYIVADVYFAPFTPATSHHLDGATKGVLSTLLGIAIDQGYIGSVERPVLEFFPGRSIAHLDADKQAMTLADLLTMRSGFACGGGPENTTTLQMLSSPDWVQFVLDLPMAERPGIERMDCPASAHLLSAALRHATGENVLDFAREQLFAPLGITNLAWSADPQGNPYGFSGIRMAPHDMAKLGYLYLQGGQWEGRQVVSANWVQEATTGRYFDNVHGEFGEGYFWTVNTAGPYFKAHGMGEQVVYVLPEQDMVVVLTGAGGRMEFEGYEGYEGYFPKYISHELLHAYLLPAAVSDRPLPANTEGLAQLQARIQQAAAAPAISPEAAAPLPELARQISGQAYLLEPNPLGLRALSLSFERPDEARFDWTWTLDVDSPQVVTHRVGLDGVPRISPGRFGLPAAAVGEWTSPDTFVLTVDEIGNVYRWHITLCFAGEALSVELQEQAIRLGQASITGQLER